MACLEKQKDRSWERLEKIWWKRESHWLHHLLEFSPTMLRCVVSSYTPYSTVCTDTVLEMARLIVDCKKQGKISKTPVKAVGGLQIKETGSKIKLYGNRKKRKQAKQNSSTFFMDMEDKENIEPSIKKEKTVKPLEVTVKKETNRAPKETILDITTQSICHNKRRKRKIKNKSKREPPCKNPRVNLSTLSNTITQPRKKQRVLKRHIKPRHSPQPLPPTSASHTKPKPNPLNIPNLNTQTKKQKTEPVIIDLTYSPKHIKKEPKPTTSRPQSIQKPIVVHKPNLKKQQQQAKRVTIRIIKPKLLPTHKPVVIPARVKPPLPKAIPSGFMSFFYSTNLCSVFKPNAGIVGTLHPVQFSTHCSWMNGEFVSDGTVRLLRSCVAP